MFFKNSIKFSAFDNSDINFQQSSLTRKSSYKESKKSFISPSFAESSSPLKKRINFNNEFLSLDGTLKTRTTLSNCSSRLIQRGISESLLRDCTSLLSLWRL